MTQPLWTPSPSRIAASNLACFMAGLALKTYEEAHRFSIDNPEEFWRAVWDYGGVRAERRGERSLIDADKMPGARYFPEARLNYAENLLRRTGDGPALIFRGETKVRSSLSWDELRRDVGRMQRALIGLGIGEGDRVCAVVPNMPETVVCFLAAASLGAIWSSCSPDFGERGILDRFGQIAPKLLIACDGYLYGGKTHAMGAKIAAVLKSLPSAENTIAIHYADDVAAFRKTVPRALDYAELLAGEGAAPPVFAQLPFDHPLYILYSSGTTGVPKCIVHRAGGILLKHLSEHLLNTDTKESDRLFYFSTCGWMMWNWLVSGLAAGATLLLYDGSPFHPSEKALFDFADEEAMTILGTSAKYIDAVRKTGTRPRDTHELISLRTMLSTGSPLAPASFDFVYDAIKSDIHLASISGGTDICGCFVGGNPLSPVWRGEIQGPMLGMAVAVVDEDAKPLASGTGELVCTKPFPSMPAMFWNDPNGEKYRNAYFARFPGVWHHGDFAEWTPHGGMIIQGRSDATLNPGGVRIGTAEIYAQVERVPEVVEALAIAQDWDNDVRVVLFVRLQKDAKLDEALRDRIKREIRAGASPRHVPAVIVAITDIPRTKSGKIVELAVRDIVHGRAIKNREALANPEALDFFRDLPELAR